MRENGNFERELDGLFRSYRAATPDPDVDPLFTPRLWEKIEAQRSFTFSMRRWTRTLVASAAALCCLMGVLLLSPWEPAPVLSSTYVEALSQEQSPEILAYVDFEHPTGDLRAR
jgi:hypothetical protein